MNLDRPPYIHIAGSVCRMLLPLILLTLVVGVAAAQIGPVFTNLSRADGLSGNRIIDVVQDHKGFIWIGTESGLNRYDGHDFIKYNKETGDFISDEIQKLFVDSEGNLWVCSTGGGVYLYRQSTDDFEFINRSTHGLVSDRVQVIIEDANKLIWIGTDSGLNSFDRKNNKINTWRSNPNNPNSLSHNNIFDIISDEQGNLWIGTFGGGLNYLDVESGVITVIQSNTSSVNNQDLFIYDLEFLNSNTLMIGTSGSGLLSYDIQSKKLSSYPLQSCMNNEGIVRTVTKDSKGNLWVGTDGNGLVKIHQYIGQKPQLECYIKQKGVASSLPGNTIYCVFEDRDNNVWIGTAWNGLSILPNELEGIEFHSTGEEHLPVLSINAISNRLWFGTDGNGLSPAHSFALRDWEKKLIALTKETFTHFIYPDSRGSIWTGTFASGLMKFDTLTGNSWWIDRDTEGFLSLPVDDIRDMSEDSLGNFWVATRGAGLQYFDFRQEQVVQYKHYDGDSCSINSDDILSFLLNDDGSMWIATYGGGLDFYNPLTKCFKHYEYDPNDQNTLSSNYIVSLLDDNRGYLWIGTREGLCKLNLASGKIERTGDNGNNKVSVKALLSDNNGNIWMSSRIGIYKFDPQLNRQRHFSQLNEEYHTNAAYKDETGKLFFGGVKGVTAFFPKDIIENRDSKLSIAITDFKLFNKSIIPGEASSILTENIINQPDLVFEYHQSVITFDFSALYFPSSTMVEYAVKMVHFDNDWRALGNQRSTTYTNLSPGDYQFQVKAQLPGSDYSESSAINITILAPVWRRWWAYIIYSAIFLIVFFMIIRYTQILEKMKGDLQLEKVMREKETDLHNLKQRFFTNISHEIRTPITLLMGALNSLVSKSDLTTEDHQKVSVIQKNSIRLLKLVNELLDIRRFEKSRVELKVQKLNLVMVAQEIFQSFSHRATTRRISFHFSSTRDTILLWFDKDQIEKVLYNLLSNAFKHSQEHDSISVEILDLETYVQLRVTDTGEGISDSHLARVFERFYHVDVDDEKPSVGFGLGLAITRDIVKLHGGEITVTSTFGKGSTFTVNLPKGSERFSNHELVQESPEAAIELDDLTALISSNKLPDLIAEYKGSRLLVIEDNAELRKYLSELLDNDFEIATAENGKIGWEIAKTELPDLIISDIMMPELDGISFTKNLKTNPKTSHIPIILLTARTSPEYEQKGLETGADDYITKPFNAELLKTRIINILKNRKTIREKIQNELILNPREIEISSPDQQFLSNLIELLEENIGVNEFNVSSLSKHLGMSHSIVYKKIKGLTGQSLVEFIRDFKLKKAAQLLDSGNMSVKETCYAVGFSDRKYFGVIFKKKFRVSPSVYKSYPPREKRISPTVNKN